MDNMSKKSQKRKQLQRKAAASISGTSIASTSSSSSSSCSSYSSSCSSSSSSGSGSESELLLVHENPDHEGGDESPSNANENANANANAKLLDLEEGDENENEDNLGAYGDAGLDIDVNRPPSPSPDSVPEVSAREGDVDVVPVDVVPVDVVPVDAEGEGAQENESDGDGDGVMLVVGPEKYTSKLMKIFQAVVPDRIMIKTTPELKLENCDSWKNQNLYNILFIIENSAPEMLTSIDETLTTLRLKYLMSMGCIDFVLAKKRPKHSGNPSPGKFIEPCDIFAFMQKFERPIVTILFEDGWEHDISLRRQWMLFLRRFVVQVQDPDGGEPDFPCGRERRRTHSK